MGKQCQVCTAWRHLEKMLYMAEKLLLPIQPLAKRRDRYIVAMHSMQDEVTKPLRQWSSSCSQKTPTRWMR